MLTGANGNAENVCRAAGAAATGMQTLGLTGRDGGRLGRLCTCCIRAPADTTADVQEKHLPVYHVISRALEAGFFGEGAGHPNL